MKKLASLLLALVMLISCVPAMAENIPSDTEGTTPETTPIVNEAPIPGVAIPVENVTISVPSTDEHTYKVYQIFTGTLSGSTLSNIMYGQNAALPEGKVVGDLVDTAALEELTKVNTTEKTDAEKLAVIKTFVNLNSAAFGTVSKAQALTAPTGYYLVIDADKAGENETQTLFVAEIVGPTEIKAKRGTVKAEKKVDDENDSVADSTDPVVDGEDTINWQDSADHDIGDAVPFKLTGTIPENYEKYVRFYYAFHDEQSAGLTFMPETVEVFVGDVKITEGYEVKTENTCSDDCSFEIIFKNLKEIEAVEAGSTITVTYKSVLNSEAKIGAEGNPNTMHLEFSNNPNGVYESTPKTDDEEGKETAPETGKTPDDTVIVFTYIFDVNKVTKENVALSGAEFSLYKFDAIKNDWIDLGDPTKNTGVAEENAVVAGSVFTWKGLDDGFYKLVEDKAPIGYNLLTAPIYFKVTAVHSNDPDVLALSELKVVATDENGTELTGENKAAFTITLSAGEIDTNVVNMAGAQLPSTGGMGTTILYVGGGILVLAAIVLLIVKRRANAD